MALIVDKAYSGQVTLNPRLVTAATRKLVDSSYENSESWQTALEFLSYMSATTDRQTPALPKVDCFTIGKANGIVEISNYRLIGCTQDLDHVTWRNVFFENSTIIYHGGPAVLENVQFKNCRFVVDYAPGGEKLVRLLLASRVATNGAPITLPGG